MKFQTDILNPQNPSRNVMVKTNYLKYKMSFALRMIKMLSNKTHRSSSGTTVILARGFNPGYRISHVTKVPAVRPFLHGEERLGSRLTDGAKSIQNCNNYRVSGTLIPSGIINPGINSGAKITVVPMALFRAFLWKCACVRSEILSEKYYEYSRKTQCVWLHLRSAILARNRGAFPERAS